MIVFLSFRIKLWTRNTIKKINGLLASFMNDQLEIEKCQIALSILITNSSVFVELSTDDNNNHKIGEESQLSIPIECILSPLARFMACFTCNNKTTACFFPAFR